MTTSATNAVGASDRDATAVTVRAHPRHRFDGSDFRNDLDQFKDVVILPPAVFESLFGERRTSGYVTLSSRKGDGEIDAYALAFTEDYGVSDPETPNAYFRGALLGALGITATRPLVEVRPKSIVDTGPLDVVRLSTRVESTEPGTCRMHPETLASIDRGDGDRVELYNPETGYRLQAKAKDEPALRPGQISLSTRARKLLQAEFPERADDDVTTVLRARQPVTCREPERPRLSRVRGAVRWLLDRAVNYHETQLRIVIGLNADEGRGTARVNHDTMDLLAIDEGDRVEIRAKDTTTTVRFRPIEPDSHLVETDEDLDAEDVRDRTVLLPSTSREEIDAVCGDTVSVRRDTRHIAIRQVTLSLFAFLGVFIGGVQTVDLVAPPRYQLHGLALTLVLSGVAIWLLLWPERERCR